MPFNDFPEEVEQVDVEARGGVITGPYKALFSGTTIILDSLADVDEGTIVIRTLPSGRKERCHVTEYEFCRGMDSIKAHYQVTFRKGEKAESLKPGNTFNIHEGQVQIGDHNTQNIVNALQALKDRIDGSPDGPEREEAGGLFRRLVTHPLITSVLGGLAGGIL